MIENHIRLTTREYGGTLYTLYKVPSPYKHGKPHYYITKALDLRVRMATISSDGSVNFRNAYFTPQEVMDLIVMLPDFLKDINNES